jgi:dihydrodipicolinate synthase/N-acetylneuraminate lyase
MNLREQWRKNLRGNIVPICTTFNSDYSLNLKGFRQHIRYIIDHGMTARYGMILVSGAAGEHPSLSFDERKMLLETAVDEAGGQIPILFGATATHTMEAIRLTQMAKKAGAAGVQMSMPYYEAPTWEDTKAFYRELNDSVDIGVMVYNTFTPPGPNMYDYRLIEFFLDLPKIAGIKWHTQQGFQYDFVYREFADQIPFYDNDIHEVYGVMMGAVGFTSHIPVFWPEYGVKLWNLIQEKNYVEALELTNRVRVPYYRLITEAWEFSSGDGIVERVACRLVGLDVGPSRKPIQPCPLKIAGKVEELLQRIGALTCNVKSVCA